MIVVHHPATERLITPLLDAMAATDMRELLALLDEVPVKWITKLLNGSEYSFFATIDGRVVVLGGLTPPTSYSVAWMLAAAPLLVCHKKEFLRASRAEWAAIRNASRSPIRCTVDERWQKSLIWLEWLGFRRVDRYRIKGRVEVVMEHQDDDNGGSGLVVPVAYRRARHLLAVDTADPT